MTEASLEEMLQSLQMSLAAHRDSNHTDDTDRTESLTPVSLITGFLGAGKSTLLAAMLQSPPDGLIVSAVVNDVGALDFDPTLIGDGALDVELSNGCGCCAASDDLAAAIDRVAATGPDLLLVESSGLTDPFAVAQVVAARPGIRLDRTVVVIDAVRGGAQLDDPTLGPVLRRQIEASTIVVISRTEVDAAAAADLRNRLEGLAPGRPIVTSSLGSIATGTLLPTNIQGAALPPLLAEAAHDFPTATITHGSPIAIERLEEVLDQLPPTVLRCKGRAQLTDGSATLFQATQAGWNTEPSQAIESTRFTVVATSHNAITDFTAKLER
ncbi:MAG: G3E family GTPase [Candidatus Poriferisodalaceae bacterium]